jgi:hypothetical protein
MAFDGSPRQAVLDHVGAEYIQHNPLVGNGREAFIAYFERMASEYPEKSISFVRAVAEDDLVALHTHQTWPGGEEYVTMDFFRFDQRQDRRALGCSPVDTGGFRQRQPDVLGSKRFPVRDPGRHGVSSSDGPFP